MLASINALFAESVATLQSWATALFAKLPNMVVAAVALALGWWLGKLAQRVAVRASQRFSNNAQLNRLGALGVRLAVFGLALFIALEVLELEKTVASLLAGLGVAGVALGFAFQDIAANSMSGLMMAIQRPFQIGDLIETSGHLGTVCHIDLRNTVLLRTDGIHVIVPNREVFGKPILNYTREAPRRVTVAVGVSYDADLDQVERVAHEALCDVPNRLDARPVEVLFTGFGGSSVDLELRFWTDNSVQGGWLQSRSDAIRRVKSAFDAHGIEIPFPIRTLDMPGEVVGALGQLGSGAPGTRAGVAVGSAAEA